jgi:hypothetical protein
MAMSAAPDTAIPATLLSGLLVAIKV